MSPQFTKYSIRARAFPQRRAMADNTGQELQENMLEIRGGAGPAAEMMNLELNFCRL